MLKETTVLSCNLLLQMVTTFNQHYLTKWCMGTHLEEIYMPIYACFGAFALAEL